LKSVGLRPRRTPNPIQSNPARIANPAKPTGIEYS